MSAMARRDASAPSIRRLLLRLVLIVYVPALVAAVGLAALETQGRLESARRDLVARNVELGRAMRYRIEELLSQLRGLAQQVPADDAGWKYFHDLATRSAGSAGMDAIVLLRPDGTPVLDTRVAWGDPLPGPAPGARQPPPKIDGRAHLETRVDAAPHRVVITATVPAIGDSGALYQVRGTLDAAQLQNLLHATPPGWIAGLVDADGVVVARTPTIENAVGRLATGNLLARIAAQEQDVFESFTFDRIPVLTSFRTSPSVRWTAVMSVPRHTLYAPVWTRGAWFAGGAAAVLTIALLAAARLQRSIVRTIETLAEGAVTPAGSIEAPLAFREAQQVRERLRGNAERLAATAQQVVDRINAQYQRRLMQQMDQRQAQIAAELHDHVGSSLAGISLLLAHLRKQVGPPGQALLGDILRQVDRTAQGVREISRGIMPAGEQQGGLPPAIEQLVMELSRRDAIDCDFRWRGDFTLLAAESAGHLYRIVQEAVANSLRHGASTRVRIALAATHGRYRLTIDDNGVGYGSDPHSPLQPGMGLKSMRARAMALDGGIEFTRSPLGGSRVRVTWPHAGRSRAAVGEPVS
jgi:signal transduction histidine kinase